MYFTVIILNNERIKPLKEGKYLRSELTLCLILIPECETKRLHTSRGTEGKKIKSKLNLRVHSWKSYSLLNNLHRQLGNK